jgi:formylglycine-generating enzyme required for sulfatase activity
MSNFTETILQTPIDMVFIKGGSFTMGSSYGCSYDEYNDQGFPYSETLGRYVTKEDYPDDYEDYLNLDEDDDWESEEYYPNPHKSNWIGSFLAETEHLETVSDFYIGKYTVTQTQWSAVVRLPKVDIDLPNNPSCFVDFHRPVTGVKWDYTTEFCDRLTNATGKHYRLPTETEWEYACRAGTTTHFNFGDEVHPRWLNCRFSEYYKYNLSKNSPVGTYPPNAWGLYEMHGNVMEWCKGLILRGGCWDFGSFNCRSSSRMDGTGGYMGDKSKFGFRLACSV